MYAFLYKLASPKKFYQMAGQLIPWCSGLAILLIGYGLLGALVLSPADYQQGDAYRIIYIHVPSAFLSMFIYLMMAFCALLSLVWRIKLADVVLTASASIGAWFTFLALITGSIWGKPMWGTWWIWDARLTSELILGFLYLGVIALKSAIPNREQKDKASAILVLVGSINIPIIHYSVYWWNTLHQGATISRFAKPAIAPSMLYPLLSMIAGFLVYYVIVMLIKARTEVLYRERRSTWVKELFK
ncbi:MAG: heme transporter permease [Gammaproteobacteria bacterium]|jgi:heme exporter protein C|nr:heme transporter permease [Gammaproteobacteria bacterium]